MKMKKLVQWVQFKKSLKLYVIFSKSPYEDANDEYGFDGFICILSHLENIDKIEKIWSNYFDDNAVEELIICQIKDENFIIDALNYVEQINSKIFNNGWINDIDELNLYVDYIEYNDVIKFMPNQL